MTDEPRLDDGILQDIAGWDYDGGSLPAAMAREIITLRDEVTRLRERLRILMDGSHG